MAWSQPLFIVAGTIVAFCAPMLLALGAAGGAEPRREKRARRLGVAAGCVLALVFLVAASG